MSRRRILAGLSITPVVVAGCGQILGLDGDSVLRTAVVADAGNPGTEASTSALRKCNGVDVPADDPRFGCGAAHCEACSVPFARDTKCVTGACAVATCTAGRADCNGRGDDGCEADLLAPETCGACGVSCPASAPFCGNDGTTIRCLVSCLPGHATCNKSCVDLQGSLEHCGACDKKCTTTVPNTDPACVKGQCGSECRAGQAPCDPSDLTKGCGTIKTYYRDNDGDGYGIQNETVTGCAAPQGWATQLGDCADDNKAVHPGQTDFFPTGYATVGGGFSYDYDCNRLEEEQPGFVHFENQCGVLPTCAGSGYLPDIVSADRPGADPFCGSTSWASCSASASGTMTMACLSTSGTSTALPCH